MKLRYAMAGWLWSNCKTYHGCLFMMALSMPLCCDGGIGCVSAVWVAACGSGAPGGGCMSHELLSLRVLLSGCVDCCAVK